MSYSYNQLNMEIIQTRKCGKIRYLLFVLLLSANVLVGTWMIFYLRIPTVFKLIMCVILVCPYADMYLVQWLRVPYKYVIADNSITVFYTFFFRDKNKTYRKDEIRFHFEPKGHTIFPNRKPRSLKLSQRNLYSACLFDLKQWPIDLSLSLEVSLREHGYVVSNYKSGSMYPSEWHNNT